MMDEIDLSLIFEESFVDNLIKETILDLKNKKIILITNGGYLNNEYILSKAEIKINDWLKLDVISKDKKTVKKVNEYPKDFLSSIIEFHYDGNQLKLVGLGKDCYIEWIFLKPKIVINGEIDTSELSSKELS